jgi:hypothetical protein
MKLTSSNGWTASADQAEIGIAIFTVISGIRPVRLRCAKSVAPLLVPALKEWHKRVEKLEPGEVQGYAFREVRGGTGGTLSNHASGTAVDIWPSRHPQGDKDGNLTKEQQSMVLEICAKYGLRSGGTYKTAKPDWMHIEINIKPANAAALIKSLKG